MQINRIKYAKIKKYLQKNLHNSIICCNFVADLEKSLGEMLEWFKRHDWKACKLQKGFRGSNPRLSANFDQVCESKLA